MNLDPMRTRVAPAAAGRRRRALGVAAALVALHSLSWAGAGDIRAVVTPLAANASYSNSSASPKLNVVVGYTVSIANVGGNTINNIRIAGNALMTDVDEKATLASVDGTAACAPVLDGNGAAIGVDCAIGQLKAGEVYPTFAVFFRSPDKDSVTPTPEGSDFLSFAGNLFYAEGTGGVPSSIPQNSIQPFSSPVAIGTPSPVSVKSSVQRSGGLYFTGKNAITTSPTATAPGDTFATSIVVPSLSSYTTAEIAESSVAGACGGVALSCNTTTITVPSATLFASPLQITIRLDVTQAPRGTSIGDLKVEYEGVQVLACSLDGAGNPQPNANGTPCVSKAFQYPKKPNKQFSFDPDLGEDFEWQILNLRNGSYKVF